MSLSGNLKTMDLAELLQWLALGRKTGSLTIIRKKVKNYIYFQAGRIISSSSNDPARYVGQFLLFQGAVTEAQLKKAMEKQQVQGTQLGKTLVEMGFLKSEELERMLRTRTEEVIYDLFLWEDGFFHFTEGGYRLEDLLVINVDVNAIIFEGVRRKDEWGRIRAVFPSNNITLSLQGDADLKKISLTPLQKKLLFLVNKGKTIAEMILELHGSDFLVSYELYELFEKNIVAVKEIGEVPREPEDPDLKFNQGLDLMRARKYQEAVQLFQGLLKSDPQNFRAHEQIELAEKAICEDLGKGTLRQNKIPYFLVPESELARYNLTLEEGFVASRVNGSWDIKSIVMLSPLRELEILQILDKLIRMKLMALK